MALRYLLPLAIFILLVGFLAYGLTRDPSDLPSPFIGKPAPQFELPSLSNAAQSVGSSDMAGKVALLNVWATWCVGCKNEHHMLMQIAATGEIPIYGLNWKDNRPQAISWLSQLGDPYVDTAFDVDGRVAIDWGVYGAPETFLVDADGTVLYNHLSPMTKNVWETEFLPRIRAATGETQ